MDISIPDAVELYTEELIGGKWKWGTYCFAHAVLRALEGEQIKVKLTADTLHFCDDCNKFGPPQTHELGSLRVQKNLKEYRS